LQISLVRSPGVDQRVVNVGDGFGEPHSVDGLTERFSGLDEAMAYLSWATTFHSLSLLKGTPKKMPFNCGVV
jgi:hypothetical protein